MTLLLLSPLAWPDARQEAADADFDVNVADATCLIGRQRSKYTLAGEAFVRPMSNVVASTIFITPLKKSSIMSGGIGTHDAASGSGKTIAGINIAPAACSSAMTLIPSSFPPPFLAALRASAFAARRRRLASPMPSSSLAQTTTGPPSPAKEDRRAGAFSTETENVTEPSQGWPRLAHRTRSASICANLRISTAQPHECMKETALALLLAE
jgi:hypothetical protein